MAKVHVISTPDRLATDADLADAESGSIWESATQLCRDVWFYLLMLNLLMGLVFVIMDVIYYDSCFLGPTLTRSVPAIVFLIGISQMSLSLIAPAFSHFLKNKHLHLHIGIPLFKTSKSTVYLFAGVMVAMSITVMMIFVMLGLAFVSSVKRCDTALVLFTQITCGIYIFIFLVIVLYLLFKKREIPAFHNHFDTFKTKPIEPSPDYETLDDNNPFSEQADNLSEVNLGETPNGNTTKDKAFTTRAALSAEMMFARYICVVVAVVWVIASVPGIPILVSGAVFYNRCPNYRHVPEWLIAHGTVLMFSAAALIGGWLVGRGQETKRRFLFLIPSMIIIAFLLIWPIVGFAWTDEARTNMLTDQEAVKSGCTREFVTGVLITSAIYSIPIFIFGYIICVFILSVCVATVTIAVMFSLPWPSVPNLISLASLPSCPSLPSMDCLPSLPKCPSFSNISCLPSLPECPSCSDISCVPSCCKRSETDEAQEPQPEPHPEEEQPQ